MESLPEGSVVICMGGTVRLMSERKLLTSPHHGLQVIDRTRYFVSSSPVGRKDKLTRELQVPSGYVSAGLRVAKARADSFSDRLLLPDRFP
jgi:hypothetical protein